MKKHILVLVVVTVLSTLVPALADAAAIEMTASVQASLDKTLSTADQTQAGKIREKLSEMESLQKQAQDWDQKTKALQTQNKQALTALNEQIKQIDADKIAQFKAAAEQTRERYKSLLATYTSINKQLETARLFKNKEMSSILRSQAEAMKLPTQLARAEIKMKDDQWKSAKADAAKKVKKVRSILDQIDPIKTRIRNKQSAERATVKMQSSDWSDVKAALKKKDAKRAVSSLTSLVSVSRDRVEEKQYLHEQETKISAVLAKAKEAMNE